MTSDRGSPSHYRERRDKRTEILSTAQMRHGSRYSVEVPATCRRFRSSRRSELAEDQSKPDRPKGLVRTAGLEPARPEGQKILSLQRLPVPPRPHGQGDSAICGRRDSRNGRKADVQTFSRSRISLPGLK